jgi:chromosome partitioning protein
MNRIVAVANQKGGVGKTTTTINLAASLAAVNRRVLLVDVDPQGNLTSGVGQKGQASEAGTIYDALTTETPLVDAAPFVIPTGVERLSLVPADQNLTGAEIEMVTLSRREERLRLLLSSIRDAYDYVFIDCPPSLGLLTLNALVAADSVLVPMQAEYFALEGLSALTATIEKVKAAYNPHLAIDGVLFTMFDGRMNVANQVRAEVARFFGDKVLETTVPRNVRLSEAPSHGKPVLLYDLRCPGTKSYLAVADEIIARTAALAAKGQPAA